MAKQERLSKEARDILNKLGHRYDLSGEAYHMIDTSKLNLYEKQKIGRKLLNLTEKELTADAAAAPKYDRIFSREGTEIIEYIGDKFDVQESAEKILKRKGFSGKEHNYQGDIKALAYAYKYGDKLATKEKAEKLAQRFLSVPDDGIHNGPQYDHIARIYRTVGMEAKARDMEKKGKSKDITSKLSSIITIAGLGAGIFFLSSNITGNAIGTQSISNGIGAVLLVIGLIAGFFWLRAKKN